MKRFLLSLLCVLFVLSAKAISYEEARQQAWFLTDKMAYELNLTSDQYERAYQINLDYLMSLQSPADCSGYYWEYRNADLRCILFDWQYNLYRTLDYFFRPVRWLHAAWHFPVCDRYRRGYFYFDRPVFYVSYKGGMWRRRGHNDPSPYIGLRPHRGVGMRDRYHRPGGQGSGRPGVKPETRPGNRPGQSPSSPRPGVRPGRGERPGDKGNGSGTVRPARPGNRNNGIGTRQRGGSSGQAGKTTPIVNRNNSGLSGRPQRQTGGSVGRSAGSRNGSRSMQPATRKSGQTAGRSGNRSFGNR